MTNALVTEASGRSASVYVGAGLVQRAPDTFRRWAAERFGPSAPALVRLESVYAANAARVADLESQAVAALQALSAAGLRAAPLKGIDAVLDHRYPDAASRTMIDIDVLIDSVDAAAGTDVLADLGYTPVPVPAAEQHGSHHLRPVALDGHAGSIELHTDLSTPRWGAVLPSAEVLDRAVVGPRTTGSRLTRTDSVAHLVVHAQLQDESHLLFRLPLRALHETALVLARGEDVDWPGIEERFRRVRRRGALVTHLRATSALFGVASPLQTRVTDRMRASVVMALDGQTTARRLVGEAAYLPRALRASRMEALYGASGHLAVWRARVRHVARGAAKRLGRHD